MGVLLLQKGADFQAKTIDGWTPLHSAARWNQADMACLLLACGADVNAKTNGGLTAIQLAVNEKEYQNVISILLTVTVDKIYRYITCNKNYT